MKSAAWRTCRRWSASFRRCNHRRGPRNDDAIGLQAFLRVTHDDDDALLTFACSVPPPARHWPGWMTTACPMCQGLRQK